MQKEQYFEKVDLTAFIYLITQTEPLLTKNGHNIVFSFPGIDTSMIVNDFYRNVNIPVLDYCRALHYIRKLMFSVRGAT